jgi:hypothetical protein
MSEPYPESRSTRWISASTSVQQPGATFRLTNLIRCSSVPFKPDQIY